ncbi:Golgi-associated RAB2 interactor protein 4 [Saccopteryx leptura]|uniref:Golgi-associated RAB2 interactor protein 4 n=1 Tax=Saccopteryx leptura TaxID=249018 RepID=UPI00339D244E
MHHQSPLPCHKAQTGSNTGTFNSTMGKLQRQLYKGEYDIFKYTPVFESDFIQITKRGEVVDVHNHVRLVTVGIAATSPSLPLPDVMLLARPAPGHGENAGHSKVTKGGNRKAAKTVELTRLLPLKFVQISIHDRKKQQLRLKFATGRSCYLQLCPPSDAPENLFAYWLRLIHLLWTPASSHSATYTTPAGDMICMPVLGEDDRGDLAEANFQGSKDEDQVSIRSLHVVTEVAGATAAAFSGGEGIQYDSDGVTAMPDVATQNTEPLDKVPGAAAGAAASATAVALSVAITEPAVPEQQSTAIAEAATRDPGGSKTSLAIVGAADMSPKSIKMARAGAANKSAGCPSNTSLSAEAGMIAATAKAEPPGETIGESANDPAAGPLVSTLPSEDCVREQSGRQQQVSPARAKARKSKRDEGQRKEREEALRSPHHHRGTESQHKPGGDKIAQKPPGWSAARQRDDKKEKDCHSPRSSRPVPKDSGTSHKSGRRSLSTSSSGPAPKRLSRIGTFFRNVKANLTTKTVASPLDNVTETMERNSMEAITEIGESGQGPVVVDGETLETMETRTFEPRTGSCKGDPGSREIPKEPISAFLTAV